MLPPERYSVSPLWSFCTTSTTNATRASPILTQLSSIMKALGLVRSKPSERVRQGQPERALVDKLVEELAEQETLPS
jgi:hypothetical protein